jgi:hypothetical protein
MKSFKKLENKSIKNIQTIKGGDNGGNTQHQASTGSNNLGLCCFQP